MNKYLLFLHLLLLSKTLSAQKVSDTIPLKRQIITSQWAYKKTAGILLTQTSFVNWSAGGTNSVAGTLLLDIAYNYKKQNIFWNNSFKGRFGLNSEEGDRPKKTDDVLEINSKFGYKKTDKSNWYYSARFNFRTQFANGYRYPNRNVSISEFFAPAYVFLGVGSQYTNPKRKYKFYLSPLTNKTTIVLDERLANLGAFGVQKAIYDEEGVLIKEGEKSKIEIGTLLTGEWESEIMENITMNNKLILYSDFLNSFGNIDLDWELKLQLKVNKYVKANIGTHIIYDDDIHEEKSGTPKVQLKQLLGIGLSYDF
jgi:hypothetical protein